MEGLRRATSDEVSQWREESRESKLRDRRLFVQELEGFRLGREEVEGNLISRKICACVGLHAFQIDALSSWATTGMRLASHLPWLRHEGAQPHSHTATIRLGF